MATNFAFGPAMPRQLRVVLAASLSRYGHDCKRDTVPMPPADAGGLVRASDVVIGSHEMSLHEIVLPETKPETEWVRGRPLAKVSPTYSHGLLQRLIAELLGHWADRGQHGRVATEWRFRVAPPEEIVRPLVPDVAYLAFTALAADASPDDVEVPLGAPTVAVEILSPDDRWPDLADKIATYLRAGTALVLVIDPRAQTLAAFDRTPRVFRRGERFEHPVLPGFRLDLEALFAQVR